MKSLQRGAYHDLADSDPSNSCWSVENLSTRQLTLTRVPTPSSAPATGAWPDAAASRKRIVATGNSVLTVIYHLLSDPDARFCDLGPGYYESRINKHRRARDLATQLQALTGQHIVIRDGKAVITDTAA